MSEDKGIRGNPITPKNRINLYYTSGGGRAKPIANAMFYFGVPHKDPIQNPIRITNKDGATDIHTVLTQPIHTNSSGRFINKYGDPIEIFSDQREYSVLVKDKNGEIIYDAHTEYDLFDIVPYLENVAGLVSLTFQDLKDGLTLGGEKVAHKEGQLWYYLGLNQPLDGLGNHGLVKSGTIVENPPQTANLEGDLHIEMNVSSPVFYSSTFADMKLGKTINGATLKHEPGQLWYYLGYTTAGDRLDNWGIVKRGVHIDNPPFVVSLDADLYIEMNKRSLDQISTTLDNVKKGTNVNGESVPFEQGQLWQYFGDTDPYEDNGGWGIVNKGTATDHPDAPPEIVRLNADYYLRTNKTATAIPQQFATYDSKKIYKTGEVCAVIDGGEIKYFQWYSNIEHLAGKNPLDPANRFIGWTDGAKPWYWVPYVGASTGLEFFSHAPKLEFAVRLVNQSLSKVQYWRLARTLGVNAATFNLGAVVNRYIRVSGSNAGTVLGDTMQSVGGGGASGTKTVFDGGSTAFIVNNSPQAPFSQIVWPHGAPYVFKRVNQSKTGLGTGVRMNLNGLGGGNGGRRSGETRPTTIYKNLHVIF